MKRYFLVTAEMGNTRIQSHFFTENNEFFSKEWLEESLIKCVPEIHRTIRVNPVILMIFEFKNESDYLDFAKDS